MEPLFIDDGYTITDVLPPAPGFHPGCEAVFRPAVSRERTAYAGVLATKDADKIDKFEADLLARHVRTLDGSAVPAAQFARLHPHVRDHLLNLVLSYQAADPGKSGGVRDS